MSKELITRMREYAGFDPDRALMHSQAADALEAQQSWIDSLEQNAKDADRIYKELESCVAALNEENANLASICMTTEQQFAAAQAQLKVMREALNAAKYATKPSITLELIEEALAQQTDDSALREMLAQERERCAEMCDRLGDEYADANAADCADNIRAMRSE